MAEPGLTAASVPIREKLLSHRVRGFGHPENSAGGLRAACAAGIPYLEIDVRASADGALFVRHDPWLDARHSAKYAQIPAARLDDVASAAGAEMFSLTEALRIFAEHASPHQRLCIDIKDYDYEATYLEQVRTASLESRVVFVSWIPQTLLRLNALGTTAPLILSYLDLRRLGLFGTAIECLTRKAVLRFGWYVMLGCDTYDRPLGSLSHGYQHALLCKRLPAPLARILAASSGGVCVPLSQVGSSLMAHCQQAGLRLWTFSVDSVDDFREYAERAAIDVVFCNAAGTVKRALEMP